MQLQGGHDYKIRVIGRETYGEAQLQLLWSTPHEALAGEAEEIAKQADAVVMFLGLTARLEGEEMRVQVPGFRGGDRTSIDLPEPQEKLLERIAALGKPTVLVLLNGSALAVNWAQANVPAIVEAWYPGQAAGTAIADVLFGDYNPGGRLPVTFYKSVNDLPAFDDYKMAGRTYRFFKGEPLYPFGHGLSYTTFGYKNLRTSSDRLGGTDTMTVRVDVTNTGKRAGDEVVQLYAQHVGSKVERPIKDLRGYQRVSLKPGETKTVSFRLPASSLAYWNPETHGWTVEADQVNLQVGRVVGRHPTEQECRCRPSTVVAWRWATRNGRGECRARSRFSLPSNGARARALPTRHDRRSSRRSRTPRRRQEGSRRTTLPCGVSRIRRRAAPGDASIRSPW